MKNQKEKSSDSDSESEDKKPSKDKRKVSSSASSKSSEKIKYLLKPLKFLFFEPNWLFDAGELVSRPQGKRVFQR